MLDVGEFMEKFGKQQHVDFQDRIAPWYHCGQNKLPLVTQRRSSSFVLHIDSIFTFQPSLLYFKNGQIVHLATTYMRITISCPCHSLKTPQAVPIFEFEVYEKLMNLRGCFHAVCNIRSLPGNMKDWQQRTSQFSWRLPPCGILLMGVGGKKARG